MVDSHVSAMSSQPNHPPKKDQQYYYVCFKFVTAHTRTHIMIHKKCFEEENRSVNTRTSCLNGWKIGHFKQ